MRKCFITCSTLPNAALKKLLVRIQTAEMHDKASAGIIKLDTAHGIMEKYCADTVMTAGTIEKPGL